MQSVGNSRPSTNVNSHETAIARKSAHSRRSRLLAGAIAGALGLALSPVAHATNYYWDTNGAAGFGSVTGGWDGTNAFWNTDITGATTGTFVAAPTSADDLFINGGTTGTMTITGTGTGSSLTISDNVAITITGGTLALGGTGASSGLFMTSAMTAAVGVSSAISLNNNPVTVQNAGTGVLTLSGAITGSQNLTLNNNGATAGGIVISTGGVNNAGTITNSGTGAGVTISGVIGANVTGVIQNSSTSSLTLSGANTFTAPVTISAGTLSVNTIADSGTSALGLGTVLNFGSGTLLYTGGATSTSRTINITTNATLTNNGTGGTTLTLTGGVAGTGTMLFRGTANIAESGIIGSGITTVAKTDGGILTLSNAANAFTGNLVIDNGIVSVGSVSDSGVGSAIGTGSSIQLGQIGFNNTGTLQLTSATGGSTNRTIFIQSNSAATGGVLENTIAGQLFTLTGTIDTTGLNAAGGLLALTGLGNGQINGVLADKTTGTSNLSITKSGTGTWTLNAAETYTGSTTVSGGTLKLGASGSLVSGNSLTTSGGTFDINNVATTLGLVTATSGTITNSGGAATNLIIGNGSTGAAAWTGALNVTWNQGASSTSLTGAWSNAGSIVLNATGAGTLTLGTGAVNPTGSITNNGTGAGIATISSAIGASVTGVTENSSTSILALSGVNTFTSPLTITLGQVNASGAVTSTGAQAAANSIVLGGATTAGFLNYSGSAGTIARTFTINAGGGEIDSTTALLTLTSPMSVSGPLIVGGANSITLSTGAVAAYPGSAATTLTKNGAGTFTFTTTTAAAITGAVPIVINQGTLAQVNSAQTGVLTNSLGTGMITFNPTSTITPTLSMNFNSQTNTYSNPITINAPPSGAGTAAITVVAGATFSGPVVLGAGAGTGTDTLKLTDSNGASFTVTLTGGITGTGNIQLNGTGTTSPITISGSAINITGSITNIGAGNSTSSTATISAPITTTNLTAITQASSNPFTVSSALALTNNLNSFTSTGSGLFTLSGAITGAQPLTLNANSTGGITLSTGGVNNAGSITNAGTGIGTTTISGTIGANVTNVTENSATSVLVISGTGSYTGTSSVQTGLLEFLNTVSLPGYATSPATAFSKVSVGSGGTLGLGYAGAGQFTAADVTNIVNGTYGVTFAATGASLGLDTTTASASFTPAIANPPGVTSLGLTKLGTNTLTLGTANTYTGPTAILNGTLSVGSFNSVNGGSPPFASSSLGAPTTVGNGTIALGLLGNTGTVSYTGAGETTDRVINLAGTTGGGGIDQSGSGLLKFTSNMVIAAGGKTLTFSGAGNGEFAGTIPGTISTGATPLIISKAGTGTWTLSGSGDTATTLTLAGGIFDAGSNGLTLGNLGAATVAATANSTLNGKIILGGVGASANGADFGPTTVGVTLTVNGVIAGGPSANIDFFSTGTLVLNGANTYQGQSQMNGATVVVSTINNAAGTTFISGSSLGIPSGTSLLGSPNSTILMTTGLLRYVGTGETTDRVLDLHGTTTAATLDQSGTGLLKFTAATTASGAGIKTFTLQGSTAGTGEIAGAIVDNSVFANTTSVIKAGTGTWTLSGANTFTGSLTVNAGNLILSKGTGAGTLADTAITLNNGATLSPVAGFTVGNTGTAAKGGTLTLNAGSTLNLADGTIGTFTLVQNSTFSATAANFAGGNLVFDIGATGDQIVVSGSTTGLATSSGGNSIAINPLTGIAAGNYTLITAAGGSLSNANFYLASSNVKFGSTNYTLSLSGTTTTEVLTVAAGISTLAPASAFWAGTINSSWATQTGGSGGATNWAASAAGTPDTLALPGVGTNVTFTANTVGTGGLITTLDQNFEINSLSFSAGNTANVAGSTIANGTGGPWSLKLDAGALNGNAAGNGITVSSTSGPNLVSANVVLGASQTWTNNSPNALTVSGVVSDGGSTFNLTKAGTGPIILTGANTYLGTTTISAGTLQIGNGGTTGTLGAGAITDNANLTFNRSDTGLTVANNITGTGTLTQIGTGTTTLTGTNGYAGLTTVDGGTLRLGSGNVTTSAGGYKFGNAANALGTLEVDSGASLTITGGAPAILAGVGANSVGVINQTGGTVSINSTASNGNYVIGYGAGPTASTASMNGSMGVYNLSGGGTIAGAQMEIGNGGSIGFLNITDGTFSPTGTGTGSKYVILSRFGSSIGVATIAGTGSQNPVLTGGAGSAGIAFNWTDAGNNDRGELNIGNRGVVNGGAAAQGIIWQGAAGATGNIGIVNLLSGGTLNAGFLKINSGASTSIVDFNGGKLVATQAITTFMQGLTSAYVYPNGGIIDNGNFAITIGQPLLAPTGNGVSTLTLNGSGYLTAPYVQITGDGVGATAIATLDGSGNINGYTITNPGVGYTTASVSLLGGGGTGTGTASLTANTSSGGLTFQGASITTLTGANTFSGVVDIKGGTLFINSLPAEGAGGGTASGIGSSSNAASNVLLDGGTLGYNGTVASASDRGYTLTPSGGGFNASGTVLGTLTISGPIVVPGTTGSQTLTLTGTGAGATGAGFMNSAITDGTSPNFTSLSKKGSGTWTLGGSTSNTYSGTTTTIGGTTAGTAGGSLILAKTGGAIAIPGNLSIGDGTTGQAFVILAGNQEISSSSSVSFTGTNTNWAYLQLQGHSQIIGGVSETAPGFGVIETREASGTFGASSLTFNIASGTQTYQGYFRDINTGVVDPTNSLALIKTGAGTLQFGLGGGVAAGSAGLGGITSHGYSGGTTIANGTLQVTTANTFPITGLGNVTLDGGATFAGILDLNGISTGITGLNGIAGTVPGEVVNNLSGTAVFTVGNNNNAGNFAGVIADHISGTGVIALTKVGTGTEVLSGPSTYSGITTINAGTLSTTNLANGLSPSGIGAATNAAANLVFSGSSTLQYTGPSITIDRNFTINAAITGTFDITQAGTTLALPGATGAVTTGLLTKMGLGALTLNGANTYNGNTTVTNGTLNVTGSLGGLGASTFVQINPTAGTNAILNVSGNIGPIQGIKGSQIAGNASVYNQTAGTVTTNNAATTANNYVVNGVAGAYGMFNLSGGTFRDGTGTVGQGRFSITTGFLASGFSAGVVYIGGGPGTALLDNTNGEWYLPGYSLGETTILTNGTFDRTGANNPFGLVMDTTQVGGAYGVLNMAGGNLLTGNTKSFIIGNSTTNGSGNSGFINLAAGTLSTGVNISTSLPAAPSATNNLYVNYAGGTFKATAAITQFVPTNGASLTSTQTVFGAINNGAVAGAPSFNGGLTIDTNTFAVTIPAATPLLGATGDGVTQGNLTVTGGSGYVGAPTVQFSKPASASGVPASGYALMSGGSVVGIVITDPGVYAASETPTVTLIGGGATVAATVTSSPLATLNSNTGGLTKLNTGTLTIQSANTFGGGVDIQGGILSVAALTNGGVAGPLGQSSNAASNLLLDSSVAGGGILQYTGTVAGTTDRNFTLKNISGGFDASGTTAGTFTLTASNAMTVAGGLGAATLILQGTGTGTAGAGSIGTLIADGTGTSVALNKLGTGTWTLTNAANSYTGPTNIGGGILSVSALANGGTASNIGASTNVASNLVFSGTSTLQYTGATQLSDRAFTINAGVTATFDITNAATNLTLAGATGATNTGALTKVSAGQLTLTGSNTYTGPTTLTAGTLSLQGGTLNSASAISMATGTTLQVHNDAATLNLGNSITLTSATGTVTIDVGNNGGATTGGTIAFGALNNGTAANNNISTVNFTGANGYVSSFSSLSLCGLAGNATTLVPTTSSVTITGSVTNPETTTGAHFDTLVLDGTSTGNFINGVISDSAIFAGVGAGDTRITKQNTSTWTLTGANTYRGPTTINGGTLAVSGSGSLANTAITVSAGASGSPRTFAATPGTGTMNLGNTATAAAGATLTLANGTSANPIPAAFTMSDNAVGTVNLVQEGTFAGAALTIGGAAGSGYVKPTLTFDIGGSSLTDIDLFTISKAVSVGTGGATINFVPLSSATSLMTGSYTFMTAGSGLGSNLSLGNASIVAGSNTYSLTLAGSSTSEIVTIGILTGNAQCYWTGSQSASWQLNSNLTSNFVDSGGNDTGLPGSTSNVIFTATSATNLSTTLDGDFTIESLTFTGTGTSNTAGTTIASGASPHTLTINAVGVNGNVPGNGITVQSGSGPNLISANVALGGSQSWTIAGGTSLAVSGNISGSGFTLTLPGAGTLTLSGTNTYSGGTVLNAGTLNLNSPAALGTGQLTVNNATIDSTATFTNQTLTTNNTQLWVSSGTMTFTGTNALNLGTGAVTLGSDATAGTFTITNNAANAANTLTIGGAITPGVGGTAGAKTLNIGGIGNTLLKGNITKGTATAITITDTSPATLTLSGTSTITNLNVNGGAGSIIDVGAGSLTFNNLGGSFFQSSTGGTINATGGGQIVLGSTAGGVNFGDNGTANGTTLTINAKISGAAANGWETYGGAGSTGVTVLTATNTFLGDVNIDGGILSVATIGNKTVPGNLGAGSNINISGGSGITSDVLRYTGTGETTNRNIILNGASAAGGAIEQVGTGNLKFTGTVTNTSATGAGKNLYLAGSTAGTGEIAGVISDQTTALTTGVTKLGSGTWTLSGANTYTGGTTILQGTLIDANASGLGGAAAPLVFGNAAGTNIGALDMSNFAQSVGGLTVKTNNVTANTITIGAGKTLAVTGGMTMGYDAGAGTGAVVSNLTVSGAGSMTVGGAANTVNISVNQAATNAAYFSQATLDVTNLASFSANVATLNLGVGSTTTGVGNLLLSNTANSITAATLQVGNSATNNGNGNGLLQFGTGTNVLDVDTFNMGFGKVGGNINFLSHTPGSPGTLTIAGDTGSTANMIVASNNGTATGAIDTVIFDVTGHNVTINAGTLQAGVGSNTSTGGATGTISFDTGTFNALNVSLGVKSGTAGTGAGTGTLNVGGGAFTVGSGGSFALATNSAATGSANGTLNITGGTFTSNVDITKGVSTGTATATVTLNGGLLDMTNHNLGGTTAINNINLQSGTLQNVLQINNGAAVTKSTAGTLVLAMTNNYSGATTVGGGILSVTGNLPNSNITVQSNATLGGNGTLGGTIAVNSGGTLWPAAGNADPTHVPAGPLSITNAANLAGSATAASGAGLQQGFVVTLAHPTTDPNTFLATGYDQLVLANGTVNGSLELHGTTSLIPANQTAFGAHLVINDLTYAASNPQPGDQFWIVDGAFGTPLVSGNFDNSTNGSIVTGSSGDQYTITYNAPGDPLGSQFGGGSHDVLLTTLNVVPEPSSIALLGLGAAGLLARRRRRNA